MKETINTYPELMRLIGTGERVTMNGRNVTRANIYDARFVDVKETISKGLCQVERKDAIEGEFIGKGDEPKVSTYQGNFDHRWHAIQQQNMLNRQMAGMQSQGMTGQQAFSGLGGLGGLFGGLF